jgi:hypothetical protein
VGSSAAVGAAVPTIGPTPAAPGVSANGESLSVAGTSVTPPPGFTTVTTAPAGGAAPAPAATSAPAATPPPLDQLNY